MVSRSLEKMMMVAIGLSTVVLVGAPVLMYSVEILTAASELEVAHAFSSRLHNVTSQVDAGIVNEVNIELVVPPHVTITASGTILTVTYQPDTREPVEWTNSYNHTLHVDPPTKKGTHALRVRLQDDVLYITFTAIS